MCNCGRDRKEDWRPVFLRRGWASLRRWLDKGGKEENSMRVRILCGAYDPSSPFIEGGCAFDWVESLHPPDVALSCPKCRQEFREELVECARVMLETRAVFVLGCAHKSFTFSRRRNEPYFSPDPDPSNADGEGDVADRGAPF